MMERAYTAVYRDLYERHWWWRAREAFLLEWLRSHAPTGGFGAILDVGCGDGLFLPRLAALGRPQGLEPDGEIVTDWGRSHGPIHVGPFDATFRSTERFGLVLLLDTLEHSADDVALMARAREILAPGGRVVATVPAHPILWTRHDRLNGHLRRYSRGHLVGTAERAGLAVESARFFFHWVFPAKLLARAGETLRSGEPRPPRIPPPAANRALYALCRLDERLFFPLRLPLGGSLLLVARART